MENTSEKPKVKMIQKRDGRRVKFNKQKIIDAVCAAYKDIDGQIDEHALAKAANIADYIETVIYNNETMLDVEKIQDYVENGLMSGKRKDVAKAYILYREKRTIERNKNNALMKEVDKRLKANDIQKQNANVDEESFGGRRGEASNALMKQYALDNCMSQMSKENHQNNEIYIHDLDSYAVGMHNCLSIPFDDLLAKGFDSRQTDIRPANSVATAFQLIAVIFQLQSLQQFGGVSATHLDWTMVPYVRRSFSKHFRDGIKYLLNDEQDSIRIPNELSFNDGEANSERYKPVYKYAMDMTRKEIQQAVEGMYHNLNTLQSRSGNQLPFTSINYGTCTLPEGRMVAKELIKGSIKGIGKFHKTPIFPCGIFQYWKGVNDKPGTPNYDLYRLALKSTSLRLYPNYANVDWSGNTGYDKNDPRTYFSTMGCRTANGFDINAEEGQNPQMKDGRGNICPVTIILPTLAMEADRDVEKFMVLLDKKINEAKDMLIERFEYICSQSPSSARFMYENGTMLGYHPEEGIRSALKHGTLALGQLGLAETLQLLIGTDHTTEKGMELAKRIEQLFKTRIAEFKKGYKLNFGVYYTPAENLCYTALKKFREKYGVIPNVSDRDYFTNSMHVPVWDKITPFDKIDIESQLTGYSSAGCITYVELDGGMDKNIDALETLVNYAMDKDIPYFAINVPNDTCLSCGYTGEFNDKCPMCESTKIQQLRRVTGYLTGDYKTAFNKGKQEETEDRFRHGNLMEGID